MSFKPTEEQAAIVDAVKKTGANVMADALAGAAKTSTLVMAAHAMDLTPTLAISFNKRIAEEMSKRLPSHITSKTLNSVGFQAWMKTTNRKFRLESDKLYSLLKDETEGLKGDDKKAASEAFASILRAVRRAKSIGYVPAKYAQLATPLASMEEWLDAFADEVEMEFDDFLLGIADRVLMKSIALAFDTVIDFDDQLYMPTLFGGKFPKFPVVMVDEAQDLSALNHKMIEAMIGGRLIAVGDPNQSIYAFRGADVNSMEYLERRFSMKRLPLSISFRCPRKVVERANRLVPHMRYPDWAAEGKVEHLNEWSSDDVPPDSAIICRNNAPLLACALRFIRNGRSVKLLGSDLGPGLIKLLKKQGPSGLPRESLHKSINDWEEKELRGCRESRRAGIIDRAACLRVFADYGDTLESAIAWAENLFKSSGNIQLMTGHKSKGLEFDTTFHLDPWRLPSKYAKEAAANGDTRQLQQERNLQYVIETRAKKELFLVNLEEFA